MDQVPTAAVMVALVALSTAMAPSAAAGGTTSHSDEITPSGFTPWVSTTHRFDVELSVGESVQLALTWEDTFTDLDLLVLPPGAGCAFYDPDCLAGIATSVTCTGAADQGQSVGVGPATESVETTADDHDQGEAEYTFVVATSEAIPLRPVAYTLEVTTGDDGHEDIDDGRERATMIRGQGHCRTP